MRILFTAYDIQPYRGSESTTSFNLVNHLLPKGVKIDVITRKNNIKACQDFFQTKNFDINFIGLDLPRWICFWKNKRFGSRLYYYLWQIYIIYFIRKYKDNYDVYQCLNFHTDSTPHFLWLLKNKKNLIAWGPISHHPKLKLWESINLKSYLISSFKSFLRNFAYISFFTKTSYEKTDIIFYPSLFLFPKVLPIKITKKFEIFSQVGSLDLSLDLNEKNMFTHNLLNQVHQNIKFLVIGRLVPLKTIHLSIKSFLNFCDNNTENNMPTLDVYGEGPLLKDLKLLVKKSNHPNLVSFKKTLPFSKMSLVYSKYDYLINFSPEGAGLTTAEAFSMSLPVITRSGTFVNELLKTYGWDLSVKNSANSLDQFVSDSFKSFSRLPKRSEHKYFLYAKQARNIYEKNLSWEVKSGNLLKAYREFLGNETY